jgi:hypothetical protein
MTDGCKFGCCGGEAETAQEEQGDGWTASNDDDYIALLTELISDPEALVTARA